ncbi:hypothetical protein [Acetomicrobium sp.]|uniref:hypothetical protein n=1 Tax=Acetomicrobium sp. TaxID=1872099 RepID=UPI002FC5B42A
MALQELVIKKMSWTFPLRPKIALSVCATAVLTTKEQSNGTDVVLACAGYRS